MNKGYFSIIQFSPDVARCEAVNIGIVLFSKDLDFFEYQLTSEFARIKALFPAETRSQQADFIKSAISSFRDLMQRRMPELMDPEAFDKFSKTRAHEIRLTDIRHIKFDDAKTELASLFKTLVPEPPAKEKKSEEILFPDFDHKLKTAAFSTKVAFDYKYTVPIINKETSAPYSYKNGVRNLIIPIKINSKSIVEQLAMEGELLWKKTTQKMIVLPKVKDSEPDLMQCVEELFTFADIAFYNQLNLEKLYRKIEQEAHF